MFDTSEPVSSQMDLRSATREPPSSPSGSVVRVRSASIPASSRRRSRTGPQQTPGYPLQTFSGSPHSAPITVPERYLQCRRDSDTRTNRRLFGSASVFEGSSADLRRRLSRSSASPPAQPSGAPSPRRNRSQSFRVARGATAQPDEQSAFRPRVATMPTDLGRGVLQRKQWRERSSSPATLVDSVEGDGPGSESYLLRQFSTTAKGGIINRGDMFRQRSRSNNSMASTTSSVTTSDGTTNRAPTPCRVVVLGASGVGKTALVTQFMTSESPGAYCISIDEDTVQTVSVLLDGEEFELSIVDQPSTLGKIVDPLSSGSRSDDFVTAVLAWAALAESDAYLVVYSSTDRRSFEVAVDLLFELRKSSQMTSKAVILVANKCDLVRCQQVSTEEGQSTASSYKCKFTETSAGISLNVDELLVGVVTQTRLKAQRRLNAGEPSQSSKPRARRSSSSLGSGSRCRSLIERIFRRGSSTGGIKSCSCSNLHEL